MQPSGDIVQKCAIVVLSGLVFCLTLMLRARTPDTRSVVFQSQERYDPPKQYTYVGKDHPNELILHVSQITHTVNATHRYGVYADDDWESVFTRSNGWVRLGDIGQPFALAMYHQMHCLQEMRFEIQRGRAGKASMDEPVGHLDHCFDYMRQSVLCCSDTSLEIAHRVKHPEGDRAGTYGLGSVHTCRDWRQVENYVEENFSLWTEGDAQRHT